MPSSGRLHFRELQGHYHTVHHGLCKGCNCGHKGAQICQRCRMERPPVVKLMTNRTYCGVCGYPYGWCDLEW